MRDDTFLFGIGVEQEAVGVEASSVRITGVHRGVTFRDESFRVRVATDGVEKGVVKNSGSAGHFGGNVTEVRNRERRNDHRALDVGDEPVQPIQRAIRAERTVVVGQRNKRPFIESDAELKCEFPSQRRVEVQGARQLDFEVVAFAVHRNRSQQHRCGEVFVAVRPGHQSDREKDRVNSTSRSEFNRLVVDA